MNAELPPRFNGDEAIFVCETLGTMLKGLRLIELVPSPPDYLCIAIFEDSAQAPVNRTTCHSDERSEEESTQSFV